MQLSQVYTILWTNLAIKMFFMDVFLACNNPMLLQWTDSLNVLYNNSHCNARTTIHMYDICTPYNIDMQVH